MPCSSSEWILATTSRVLPSHAGKSQTRLRSSKQLIAGSIVSQFRKLRFPLIIKVTCKTIGHIRHGLYSLWGIWNKVSKGLHVDAIVNYSQNAVWWSIKAKSLPYSWLSPRTLRSNMHCCKWKLHAFELSSVVKKEGLQLAVTTLIYQLKNWMKYEWLLCYAYMNIALECLYNPPACLPTSSFLLSLSLFFSQFLSFSPSQICSSPSLITMPWLFLHASIPLPPSHSPLPTHSVI